MMDGFMSCYKIYLPLDPNEIKSTGGAPVAKMKFGSIMSNVRKASIASKDSVDTSKSTPANSVSGLVSSASTRKGSEKDKDKKKSGSGLSKFKTGFLSKGKKKSEKEAAVVSTGKELKHRLFFREKRELTDEEILQAIGEDDSQKIVAQSMDEIANAATVMKKFLDGKRPLSETIAGGDTTNKTSIPGSVLYVGSLKARLSKTEGDEDGLKAIRSNAVMNTTVFLGKMISRKDKYGLIRGGSNMTGEEEVLFVKRQHEEMFKRAWILYKEAIEGEKEDDADASTGAEPKAKAKAP